MKTKKFTSIERSTLRFLDVDARTKFTKVGKETRQSQQRVHYTVNSMLEASIIQNFYTLIDYAKLDVLNFRVYFKVSYAEEQKIEELIDFLIKEPHSAKIETCGGRYDLFCSFFAYNPSQFNKILRSIMEKFPAQLQNYMVLTTIVSRHFGRKYMFDVRYPEDQLFVGGDREPENPDEIDIGILKELSQDARKNSVRIGKAVGISSKSVIERIRKLEKNGIILGFKPLLDLPKIGYKSAKISISYHNVSSEAEENLIEYLRFHNNVVFITKTLGEWNLEIDVEAENTAELRRIEIEIRQKFALLIKEIESIPIYHVYKRNYFPEFVIQKD
ncbi:MAG: Lrp/AsnC family transcriptional regulator [Candidatus Aenigmarchaeota archaeon]|nr:Lrp/AsnC family transcriptional regulator [Candidatus Aenigmarchaeota archaeon]